MPENSGGGDDADPVIAPVIVGVDDLLTVAVAGMAWIAAPGGSGYGGWRRSGGRRQRCLVAAMVAGQAGA